MFGWGPLEMVLVIFVVLLFFGAKRIPDALGSLGRGMREFKQAVGDKHGDAADTPELPAAPPAVPRAAHPAAPPVGVPEAPHVAVAPLYDPTDPITPLRSLGDPLAPPPPTTPADPVDAAKPSPETGDDASR